MKLTKINKKRPALAHFLKKHIYSLGSISANSLSPAWASTLWP